MIKRVIHYFDVLSCILHKYYWDYMAKFGRIHGVVLMYHYITNDSVATRAGCVHSPKEFEAAIMRLVREGYEFVAPKKMLGIVRAKDSTKFAVITFDDIMDDVYTNAYPILKELKIPFTLFVATNLIDKKDFVSFDHLKEMDKDELCTIGSHSVNHINLRNSDNATWEIKESKRRLEELLGHPIDFFAYPFGKHEHVGKKVIQYAKDAGFKCAFGTIPSTVSETSSQDLFYLPRMVMRG